MKNNNGALLGFIGGCLYFLLLFAMTWKGVAPTSTVGWVAVIALFTFVFIVPLAFWFPVSWIWSYPLAFTLPMLLIGLFLLTGGVFTGIIIGAFTLLAGLAAVYVARKLASICRPHTNPAQKRNTSQPTLGDQNASWQLPLRRR